MSDKLKIQTLIFDKKFYPNKKIIKDWCYRNDFKIDKRKKDPIHKYDACYRVRQRNPDWFNKKTFRCRKIGKGIKGVYGIMKKR